MSLCTCRIIVLYLIAKATYSLSQGTLASVLEVVRITVTPLMTLFLLWWFRSYHPSMTRIECQSYLKWDVRFMGAFVHLGPFMASLHARVSEEERLFDGFRVSLGRVPLFTTG
jgi:hypothetical protein